VIVCDRYLYDELANLNLRNPVERRYAALLARVVPRPMLPSCSMQIRCRHDPVNRSTRSVLTPQPRGLSGFGRCNGHLSVVPPLPVSQMTGYVMNKVAQAIHRHSRPWDAQPLRLCHSYQ